MKVLIHTLDEHLFLYLTCGRGAKNTKKKKMFRNQVDNNLFSLRSNIIGISMHVGQ